MQATSSTYQAGKQRTAAVAGGKAAGPPGVTAGQSGRLVKFSTKARRPGPAYRSPDQSPDPTTTTNASSPDISPARDAWVGRVQHLPSPRPTAYKGAFSSPSEKLLRAAQSYRVGGTEGWNDDTDTHSPMPHPNPYPGVLPSRAAQQAAAADSLAPERTRLAMQCAAGVVQGENEAYALAAARQAPLAGALQGGRAWQSIPVLGPAPQPGTGAAHAAPRTSTHAWLPAYGSSPAAQHRPAGSQVHGLSIASAHATALPSMQAALQFSLAQRPPASTPAAHSPSQVPVSSRPLTQSSTVPAAAAAGATAPPSGMSGQATAASATPATGSALTNGAIAEPSFEQVHALLTSITTPSRKPAPSSPARPLAGTSPARRLLPEPPATWPALIDPVTCSPRPARDMAAAAAASVVGAQPATGGEGSVSTAHAGSATPTKNAGVDTTPPGQCEPAQPASHGPAYGKVAHARSSAMHRSKDRVEQLLVHSERQQALGKQLTLSQVCAVCQQVSLLTDSY
jgi:hypothetical protein